MKRLERDAKKLNDRIRLKTVDERSVLLCFATDPYMHFACGGNTTRRAIEILHENNLKVTILTKGGHRSMRDFDILTPLDTYATTLTFINNIYSENWEPGAALPLERLEALAAAHKKGINTWVSLEPIISLDQTLQLIDASQEYTQHYKVGKLNYVESANNWPVVLDKVVERLESYGKSYYIKNDLMKYAGPGMKQQVGEIPG